MSVLSDRFYLCHPDDTKSCAACCGLYNFRDYGRDSVTEALRLRTRLFRELDPAPGNLEEFRSTVTKFDRRPRLLEAIFTCEFLGFLDDRERTPGCLIHPEVTGGSERRDHSYYGAETCGGHRCSSYLYLNDSEVEPVVAALDDWYLYGLCITDIDLVKGFYEAVSRIRYDTLKPEKLIGSPRALDAFREYLMLKETWPYRRGKARFGQYVIEDGAYRVEEMDWNALGTERPPEARVLRSLGSEFGAPSEVQEALGIIRSLVERAAEAVGPVSV